MNRKQKDILDAPHSRTADLLCYLYPVSKVWSHPALLYVRVRAFFDRKLPGLHVSCSGVCQECRHFNWKMGETSGKIWPQIISRFNSTTIVASSYWFWLEKPNRLDKVSPLLREINFFILVIDDQRSLVDSFAASLNRALLVEFFVPHFCAHYWLTQLVRFCCRSIDHWPNKWMNRKKFHRSVPYQIIFSLFSLKQNIKITLCENCSLHTGSDGNRSDFGYADDVALLSSETNKLKVFLITWANGMGIFGMHCAPSKYKFLYRTGSAQSRTLFL